MGPFEWGDQLTGGLSDPWDLPDPIINHSLIFCPSMSISHPNIWLIKKNINYNLWFFSRQRCQHEKWSSLGEKMHARPQICKWARSSFSLNLAAMPDICQVRHSLWSQTICHFPEKKHMSKLCGKLHFIVWRKMEPRLLFAADLFDSSLRHQTLS